MIKMSAYVREYIWAREISPARAPKTSSTMNAEPREYMLEHQNTALRMRSIHSWKHICIYIYICDYKTQTNKLSNKLLENHTAPLNPPTRHRPPTSAPPAPHAQQSISTNPFRPFSTSSQSFKSWSWGFFFIVLINKAVPRANKLV